MNELVSVVIPTYNYAHFLCNAVDSVLAQTYRNIEIIVVDDGSSDNTSEIAKGYGARINYIYQANRGLSAARNAGIRVAGGEFIAFLDADDMWMPDKIMKQVQVLKDHGAVGAVGSNLYQVDENLRDLAVVKNKNYAPEKFSRELLFFNIVGGGGSSILLRKECFRVAGLFDEELRAAEDWDMWLRISKKFSIRNIDEPLVKIRLGSYSMSHMGNAQKMLDNELIVLKKYFGHGFSLLKGKAISQRYFSAAWAFSTQGRNKDAFFGMCRCFMFYPMALFQKNKVGLYVKVIKDIIFGRGEK